MYHVEYLRQKEKQEELLSRKNEKSSFYNGIYLRWKNPVLTRDHVPLHWRYDLNPETNPFFLERLGVNAVFNAGAIYLDGKYCLVVRVEGNDRKSFFAVAESENGIDIRKPLFSLLSRNNWPMIGCETAGANLEEVCISLTEATPETVRRKKRVNVKNAG